MFTDSFQFLSTSRENLTDNQADSKYIETYMNFAKVI